MYVSAAAGLRRRWYIGAGHIKESGGGNVVVYMPYRPDDWKFERTLQDYNV